MAGPRPSIWDDGLPPPQAAYPGISDGQPSNIPLFGLAPGGVYQASPVTRTAGALLPHRFTLTPTQRGGLFSVALSRGSPLVDVIHHPALWSPDFPPADDAARGRAAHSGRYLYTIAPSMTQLAATEERGGAGVRLVNPSRYRWRDLRRRRPQCSRRGAHGAPRRNPMPWPLPSPVHTRV